PTTPEIIYGFGLSMGYKRFDLSTFLQGSSRSSFWINQAATAPFISYAYAGENTGGRIMQNQLLQAYADNHWSEENRDLYALWPRLDYQATSNIHRTSSWFMRNGAFWRFKPVEVRYALTTQLVNRVKISHLRVFLTGPKLASRSSF